MKNFLSLSLLAAVLLSTAGCFVYERRAARTVVVDSPVANERVVTVLPVGYQTRVVRGTTYYYTNDSYYRTAPGGYVTTTRPW